MLTMYDELDQSLSKLFKSHAIELTDKEFADRVMRKLPQRGGVRYAKPVILAVSMLVGMLSFFLVGGFDILLRAYLTVVSDLVLLSPPSAGVVLFILGFFACSMLVPLLEYKST